MAIRPRTGSALLLTMFTVASIAAIIAIASDNIASLARQQDLFGGRRQASIAAESVAALVEAKLVSTSAEEQNLSTDISSQSASYWNLRGYCPGTSNGGYDDGNPPMWYNGCAVRWRLEPIKVYAGFAQDPTTLRSQVFMVNPTADPANETARENAAVAADPNNTLIERNTANPQSPPAYNFRIVAEAWALTDHDSTTARPWRNHTEAICHAQAQRVVQLNRLSLFRYALFHAATTPVGDLELSTGTTLTVSGAVHSNGRIYFCGGDNAGLTSSPVDYHLNSGGAFSPPQESVVIGGTSSGSTTQVTGLSGIFRLSKLGDLLAVANHITGANANPWSVPLSGFGGMTGVNDLNGDTASSQRHSINGHWFTCANDSRTLTGSTGMATTFGGLVMDSQNGGHAVNTLANIPQLGGRPFEAQLIAGDVQLYTTKPTTPTDRSGYTILATTSGAVPLYYNQNPTIAGAVPQIVATGWPVLATDLPLYWTDAAHTVRDVTTALASSASSVGDADAGQSSSSVAGFNSNEAKSWYLERALYGTSGTAMVADSITGLVIRERQDEIVLPVPPATTGGTRLSLPTAVTDLTSTASTSTLKTWATYLKEQYVVYFSGRNVTDAFFNDIASLSNNSAFSNCIALEDEFVDARESIHLWRFYPGIDVANYAPTSQPYRQNVLTLNIARIESWLQNTPMTAFGSTSTAKANTYFNGLIYVARTRRASSYDPIASPALKWSSTYGSGSYTNPSSPLERSRNGVAPVETMRTHVRVRNGANITFSHAASPNGTNRGLTLVTPDRLYLWGDFNTVTDSSQTPVTPPCAVYADGVVALSNAWSDANNRAFTTTQNTTKYSSTPATSTKYYVSLVTNNVPTETWNAQAGGTGGCSNMVRFLEDWSANSAVFTLRGSAVVMNAQRYSKGALAYASFDLHMYDAVYRPPQRDILFNTDLLTQTGQPPFSPFGMQVTRVVGFVNTYDQ